MSRRDIGTDDPRVHVRPGKGSRPRTKIRPNYASARRGRVTAIDRGRYAVTMLDDATELVAVKARELPRGSVAVGDVCAIVGDLTGTAGTLARIVTVDERHTALRRTAEDGDGAGHERVIVANADQMVIVSALTQPAPKTGFIDRCLVAAYDAGLEPILVFTKADLTPERSVTSIYAPLGLQIFVTALPESTSDTPPAASSTISSGDGSSSATSATSATSEASILTENITTASTLAEGVTETSTPTESAPETCIPDTCIPTAETDEITAVKKALARHMSVLIGQSGVGKSTLLNALVPQAARATGEVNAVTGKGRHTSTSAMAFTLTPESTDTSGVADAAAPCAAILGTAAPRAATQLPDSQNRTQKNHAQSLTAQIPPTIVIDTPGVRGFGLAHVSPDSLLRGFPDLLMLTDDCPRGCTHHPNERECALADADSPALIARVASYHRLLEALDKPDWL